MALFYSLVFTILWGVPAPHTDLFCPDPFMVQVDPTQQCFVLPHWEQHP